MIEQNKKMTSIDGFRGILALIIALFHFGQSYLIGSFFHRGYFAVEVFALPDFRATNTEDFKAWK